MAGVAARETLLSQALALWRGPALSDVAFGFFGEHKLGHLDELRLRARELLINARLALGRHAEVIERTGGFGGDAARRGCRVS